MIKKEITLCGKPVMLAYCFATEIGFKTNADCDIETFVAEVVESFQNQQQAPDLRKCIYLIYAAALAYAESQHEDVTITAEDMMYQMQPTEMGTALATILQMRGEFYHVPSGEPDDKPKDGEKPDDPKNA